MPDDESRVKPGAHVDWLAGIPNRQIHPSIPEPRKGAGPTARPIVILPPQPPRSADNRGKPETIIPFVLGQRVKWTSQASGVHRTKYGTIIAVVPAGQHPEDHPSAEKGVKQLFRNSVRGRTRPAPRNHESYVVLVRSTPFWPWVKLLSPDDETRP